MTAKIEKPGLYPDVPAAAYHGTEICPAPSISSSGLREIAKCPAKYWWNSALNPARPPEEKKDAYVLGSAAHALALEGMAALGERFHLLPEGFSRAATVKQAEAIAAATAAEAAGKTLLKFADFQTVQAMAAALTKHPIHKALAGGKAEQTLCWKDAETGVWLRCRPDWLPDSMRFIPDYKTCESSCPEDFAKSAFAHGYHQQAALYLEGLEAVFGPAKRDFYFIAQEKEAPYIVQPIALDDQALEWGRRLNRAAIRIFARCLAKNEWPAYADDFVTVSLPKWQVDKYLETYAKEIFDERNAA